MSLIDEHARKVREAKVSYDAAFARREAARKAFEDARVETDTAYDRLNAAHEALRSAAEAGE